MLCPFCKSDVEPFFTLTPELKHYGKNTCPLCSRSWWQGKPEVVKRRKTSKYTIEDLGIECCELCRRPKDMLGDNQTLEIHHKHLLEDGGLDERDNLLVLCTPCHKDVHWKKTYFHDHYLRYRQQASDSPMRDTFFAMGREL